MQVAFEYFGWTVAIDDTLPNDAYVVDPELKRVRMRQAVWHVVSRDGLIEDIIDTQNPDVGGLVYALSEQYENAKAAEMAERPEKMSRDRVQVLMTDMESLIQLAAANTAPDVLMARTRDARAQLLALREELDVAQGMLELAESTVVSAIP